MWMRSDEQAKMACPITHSDPRIYTRAIIARSVAIEQEVVCKAERHTFDCMGHVRCRRHGLGVPATSITTFI